MHTQSDEFSSQPIMEAMGLCVEAEFGPAFDVRSTSTGTLVFQNRHVLCKYKPGASSESSTSMKMDDTTSSQMKAW
jgi:hypothetical protein